jgi:hypothetical protein
MTTLLTPQPASKTARAATQRLFTRLKKVLIDVVCPLMLFIALLKHPVLSTQFLFGAALANQRGLGSLQP